MLKFWLRSLFVIGTILSVALFHFGHGHGAGEWFQVGATAFYILMEMK